MQPEIESSIQYKCLSCLGQTPVMHNLTEMFDDCIDYGGMLKICLHCEINKPYFPQMLCEPCASIVKEFFKFKMRFLNNEILLIKSYEIKHESDACSENSQCAREETKPILYDIEDFEEDKIIFQIIGEELKDKTTLENEENVNKTRNNEQVNSRLRQRDDEYNDEWLNDDACISLEATNFRCAVCRTFFIDSTSLDVHLLKHKNHKCNICGRFFAKKSYLSEHMVTHKNVRDIGCLMCTKTFKSRHSMRAHMQIHTNPGSYVCETCGRPFNHQGTMNTHIKLKHSQNKDYLCIWCGIKFNLKSSLDKHTLRKHSVVGKRTKYQCTECNRVYLDKSTLDRHCKIKHSSDYQLVSCEFCNKEFSDKNNMLRHKRSKHVEHFFSKVIEENK